jgi:hypothetical protein
MSHAYSMSLVACCEQVDAFSEEDRAALECCAAAVAELWKVSRGH